MTITFEASIQYVSGKTVLAQPLLQGNVVGGQIGTAVYPSDASIYGVNLAAIVTPVDQVAFYVGAQCIGLADIAWDGTKLVTLPVLAAAIAAIVTTVSVVVAPSVAQDSQIPNQIICKRGDTLSSTLTLGTITGWQKILFTAKKSGTDLDSAAIFQVEALSGGGGGLTILNGAVAATPSQASLVVSDATVGTVLLTLTPIVTAGLAIGNLFWDCEIIYSATNIKTPGEGIFATKIDITQAIS